MINVTFLVIMSVSFGSLSISSGSFDSFKIIYSSYCWVNDGCLVSSSSLAGYVSGLIAGLMSIPAIAQNVDNKGALSWKSMF